uniref:Uncharacterized protein n=1 Tax=viral metagenome TaxID=1070528 RepID=A0A6C0JNY0_9ZZZZ
MNRSFDYNGTIVAPSNPIKKLKTVKKFLIIDSSDRDRVKFPYNGDMVIYFPRVYENVISLRLAGAEFPDSQPYSKSGGDIGNALYFLIDIEGLNKTDECSVGADRSGYPDSAFAKIPFGQQVTDHIFYNDHSAQENIAEYRPAIGKLDRMHIRTRTHLQKSTGDYVYWNTGEYSLTFEIEYLDNVFDDFSQFESRISERA